MTFFSWFDKLLPAFCTSFALIMAEDSPFSFWSTSCLSNSDVEGASTTPSRDNRCCPSSMRMTTIIAIIGITCNGASATGKSLCFLWLCSYSFFCRGTNPSESKVLFGGQTHTSKSSQYFFCAFTIPFPTRCANWLSHCYNPLKYWVAVFAWRALDVGFSINHKNDLDVVTSNRAHPVARCISVCNAYKRIFLCECHIFELSAM